eukprot:scaffold15995_cov18-Tisochrysis_lutea.AAC.1
MSARSACMFPCAMRQNRNFGLSYALGREVEGVHGVYMKWANVGRIPMGHAATCVSRSPFGYQTNLMVYGAGNYKTMEFIKYGAGLKVGNGRAEGCHILVLGCHRSGTGELLLPSWYPGQHSLLWNHLGCFGCTSVAMLSYAVTGAGLAVGCSRCWEFWQHPFYFGTLNVSVARHVPEYPPPLHSSSNSSGKPLDTECTSDA